MPRSKRSLFLLASFLGFAAICIVAGVPNWLVSRTATAASPQDLVNAAYAAMGGGKVQTVVLKEHL